MSPLKATLATLAAVLAAGCGGATGTATATRAEATKPPPHYTLTATSRCLKRRGAKVGPVRPRDSRLRQLHDLAQRNSIEADFAFGRVGLAFSKTVDDAKLLVELLTVPKDPYRLVRRGNAVLLYRPTHRRAYAAVLACLPA